MRCCHRVIVRLVLQFPAYGCIECGQIDVFLNSIIGQTDSLRSLDLISCTWYPDCRYLIALLIQSRYRSGQYTLHLHPCESGVHILVHSLNRTRCPPVQLHHICPNHLVVHPQPWHNLQL